MSMLDQRKREIKLRLQISSRLIVVRLFSSHTMHSIASPNPPVNPGAEQAGQTQRSGVHASRESHAHVSCLQMM